MDEVNLDKFLTLDLLAQLQGIIIQSIDIGVLVSKTVFMAYSQKKNDPTIHNLRSGPIWAILIHSL